MTLMLCSKTLFLSSPGHKTAIWAQPFYTRPTGTEMCCLHFYERRDDIYDNVYRRFSSDNGRTWSEAEELRHHWQTDEGTLRTWREGGGAVHVDAGRGLLVRVYLHGVLPNDNALDGMMQWGVEYAVSDDGGRSNLFHAPVVQRGEEYTPEHPVRGVWIGRNSLQSTGDILRNRQGQLLMPVQISPLGADGELYNPGGAAYFLYAAVLIGTWTADNRLEWDLSQPVMPDPDKTTKGLFEPALAQMPDGRILMVMRGSNQHRPDRPGYKWYSISEDEGYTWSEAQPWTYGDGRPFYSPSSISSFFRHTNGKTYWLGNITAENPDGNSPRYPLVMGEVDDATLLLQQETLLTVDDRQPNQHADLHLSNFQTYEDRETGEIVITCTHFLSGGAAAWDGDAYQYRLSV